MIDVVELDPSDPNATVCGHCGRAWDEKKTPFPAARCPFEYDHEYDEDEMTDPVYIMLLNDGETFTNLDGCIVIKVPTTHSGSTEDIEMFVSTANSYDTNERKAFDNSIVAYFEERDNNFRFVSYIPK
jgi:hypothetical protein